MTDVNNVCYNARVSEERLALPETRFNSSRSLRKPTQRKPDMNFWIILSLIALVISLVAYVTSVRKNQTKNEMDQSGPWVVIGGVSVFVGMLLSGIILHKIPTAVHLCRWAFILSTSAVFAIMTMLICTPDNNKIPLFQDRFFGKKDSVTGIQMYLIGKAGRITAWLIHIKKLSEEKWVELRKHNTPEQSFEWEPASGAANVVGEQMLIWEPDPDANQVQLYAQINPIEAKRVEYVTDVLENAAAEYAGQLAKTKSSDYLMNKTSEIGVSVIAHLTDMTRTLGVKIKQVLYKKVDWEPEYKKVLGDIALAKKLIEVASELAGDNINNLAKTEEGRKERQYWLEQAQISTGIGDIRKDILELRGLESVSLTNPEDVARLAGEVMSRRRKQGKEGGK